MSTQVAVWGQGRGRLSMQREAVTTSGERPLVRLIAFGALGLYGVLRWTMLMTPRPTGRLLGLLLLALVLAGAGLVIRRRSWMRAGAVTLVALIATFGLSGVPLAWIAHLRVTVTVDALGEGLSTLPRILVPYTGINEWVRVVTVLGAGLLLTTAGLVLAFASRPLSDLARGCAALPLIVLAVLPSTLLVPRLPYLHGLVLFALLATFMWGERTAARNVWGAILICVAAGTIGLLAAPGLERHKPWINYQALAGDLAGGHVDSFDWSQRYGPITWPRDDREVLDVQAQHADYWKAENLDLFDGRAWASATFQTPDQMGAVSPASRTRWIQTLRVTIRAMKSPNVIAAGTAAAPIDVSGPVLAGASQGTWTVGGDLGPGDSYVVTVYAPHPSAGELAAAGTRYPVALLPAYLSLSLPARASHGVITRAAQQVVFPPFGSSRVAAYGDSSADPVPAVERSPYARELALARRLAHGARTPYAYVTRVERYLATGFTYNETPPRTGAYPLDTFLFDTRSGYCQQFAGAMALLLRMGGIPSRVAVGFTSGHYSSATRSWVVTDVDAHAWVEAWFPGYGWVRIDPTPAAAPARGGHLPLPAIPSSGGAPPPATDARHRQEASAAGPGKVSTHGHSSSDALLIAGVAVPLVALALAAAFVATRRRPQTAEELLRELVRAFDRSGRPIQDGVTLVGLEHRLRIAPDAAGYVRALRLARFDERPALPTPRQRRALRAQLRAGLGLGAALRALWALPPRRQRKPSRQSPDSS